MSKDRMVMIWTSGDRDVALKMAFMYTFNAKRFNWWSDITLIVWGPSAQLLSEDKKLQEYIQKMIDAGVTVEACKSCADMYEVSETLAQVGVDVKYMGEILTKYIKEGRAVLTV